MVSNIDEERSARRALTAIRSSVCNIFAFTIKSGARLLLLQLRLNEKQNKKTKQITIHNRSYAVQAFSWYPFIENAKPYGCLCDSFAGDFATAPCAFGPHLILVRL